ncbi:hypothetical protein ACKGJO_08460 [Gracilimonas sp. Q87]|uniref:hypothetical protein n=1 Tax=Gracilimonas sp. Q87 TaxID=3384766 RepID=UPI00398456E0
MNSLAKDSKIWQWAIFSFILAGFTGFIYRLGFVTSLPFDLNLENVRHAHSHLMFFGWASLLPLYLIKVKLVPGYHAALGVKFMKGALWGVLVFGILSYPFFLIWGYRSVPVNGSFLPLSTILSGLVMVGWYVFMIGYIMTRFRKKDHTPNVWLEGALVMLLISSLGAWGVGAVEMFNFGGPLLGKALTHFFLATFVEGWVVLVLLGLISESLGMKENDYVISPNILVGLIACGAPLTFPYGISESMLDLNLSVTARIGGVLIVEGVLLFLYSIIKRKESISKIWIWPLLLLGLKSLMQIIAAVMPADLWLSEHGIRILYLHVLLLGGFTLGVTAYMTQEVDLKPKYFYVVLISVFVLLISLLWMTSLWPLFLSGVWIYTAITVIAMLPVIAMLWYWLGIRRAIQKL